MNIQFLFFNHFETDFIILKALVPAFMSILFLQSGIDKVVDYNGNLAYFKEHFKNSPLASMIGLMTPLLTVLELGAGFFSAIGVVMLFLDNETWAFWGLILSAISFLCLFLGQRMAKDYAGAVSIATYFIVNLIGLLML